MDLGNEVCQIGFRGRIAHFDGKMVQGFVFYGPEKKQGTRRAAEARNGHQEHETNAASDGHGSDRERNDLYNRPGIWSRQQSNQGPHQESIECNNTINLSVGGVDRLMDPLQRFFQEVYPLLIRHGGILSFHGFFKAIYMKDFRSEERRVGKEWRS